MVKHKSRHRKSINTTTRLQESLNLTLLKSTYPLLIYLCATELANSTKTLSELDHDHIDHPFMLVPPFSYL